MYSKSDPRPCAEKSPEHNMKMAMDPESWKLVTKSPAALKSKLLSFNTLKILAFKRDLKGFRDEMAAQK